MAGQRTRSFGLVQPSAYCQAGWTESTVVPAETASACQIITLGL